jgi:hypothetical protein
MGMFEFPPPLNDVKFILVVPDQPKTVILQVSSFRTTYFDDLWTLTSPSSSMEGVGNPGMAMPLSLTEVAYSIFQQSSTNLDPAPPQELDPVLETIWAQDFLTSHILWNLSCLLTRQ